MGLLRIHVIWSVIGKAELIYANHDHLMYIPRDYNILQLGTKYECG